MHGAGEGSLGLYNVGMLFTYLFVCLQFHCAGAGAAGDSGAGAGQVQDVHCVFAGRGTRHAV